MLKIFHHHASQEENDFSVTGDCKPPCRWTDFSPRLMNYGSSDGYVASRKTFCVKILESNCLHLSPQNSTKLHLAYVTTITVERTEGRHCKI